MNTQRPEEVQSSIKALTNIVGTDFTEMKTLMSYVQYLESQLEAERARSSNFDPWKCTVTPRDWAERFYTCGNYGAEGQCGDREDCESTIEYAMKHAVSALTSTDKGSVE